MARTRAQFSDFKLQLAEGSAELLKNGEQIWASDSDEDFMEEFGEDNPNKNALQLGPDDLGYVLDYLVDIGEMTDDEADMCPVDPGPEDEDLEDSEEEED